LSDNSRGTSYGEFENEKFLIEQEDVRLFTLVYEFIAENEPAAIVIRQQTVLQQ
jgi:hypothetical protein